MHPANRQHSALAMALMCLLLAGSAHAQLLSQKQIHAEMIIHAKANVDFARGDYLSAQQAWLELADMGNGQAMRALGRMHQEGAGIPADPAKAFYWFEQAAAQGEPRSLHEISMAYKKGEGTRASSTRASAFLRRAAFAGVPEAQYEHGLNLLAEEPDLAARWIDAAYSSNAPGAGDQLRALEATGYTLPASSPQERRVGLFLEEMDGALNARDVDIYLMLFTEDVVIDVRLPGAMEFTRLTREEYSELWYDTFTAAQRFRAHRGELMTEDNGTVITTRSEIQQYSAGAQLAQQLDLFEQLTLVDTRYGLRASAVRLEAKLPELPVLSP